MKITTRLFIRIFFICPHWNRHTEILWNFHEIKDLHFWCGKCPLKRMNGIGNAYRRTLEKED